MSKAKSRVTEAYMVEMAEAIDGITLEDLGLGVGFAFVAFAETGDGATEFRYISNVPDATAIKEILCEVISDKAT